MQHTSAPGPTRQPGIAERLKAETRALHGEAERSGVMAQLLRGQLAQPGYTRLLRNLHALYATLEAELAHHPQHPVLAALQGPAWQREAPLAADLLHLHGPGWAAELPLATAMQHYTQRLQQHGRQAPLQLAAHAYVRTLGDLHGGQVLRRVVGQALGLQQSGLAFYDFGDAGQVQRLIACFREVLQGLPAAGEAADSLVAEACWAFEQHRRLFEELAAGAHQAAVPPGG